MEAIDDPTHERHAELSEWIYEDVDPATADTKWLAEKLTALAEKWSRKPSRKYTRRC